MRRMIVVEGPDGSGKSTLLSQLAETFEVEVCHSGGPPRTEMEWLNKLQIIWNLKWRADRGETILVDRLPQISEPIYGGLRGRTFHGSQTILNREIAELGLVIIYCKAISAAFMQAKISHELKGHKPPEHLKWVLDNYPAIAAAYDMKFNALSGLVPIVHYSWPNETYENLLEKLKCAASS